MSKARDLADLISTGGLLADGAVSVSEISDITATAAELNTLDGITASTADLNNVAGINSDVQTQLDLKAPLASPTFTGDATFDTNTLAVDSTNNRVGIGTSSPNNLLTLNSNTANTAMTIQSSDSGVAAVVFGDQSDFSRGRILYDNSGESMAFETNNLSEAMRIDSFGNVGIGRTDPADGNFSDGSSAFVTSGNAANIGSTHFATNSDDSSFIGMWSGHSGANPALAVKNTKALTFGNWSALNGSGGFTEHLRINTSGEIGIGGANYGTAGQVLTSGGSGAAPTWGDVASSGPLFDDFLFR